MLQHVVNILDYSSVFFIHIIRLFFSFSFVNYLFLVFLHCIAFDSKEKNSSACLLKNHILDTSTQEKFGNLGGVNYMQMIWIF